MDSKKEKGSDKSKVTKSVVNWKLPHCCITKRLSIILKELVCYSIMKIIIKIKITYR